MKKARKIMYMRREESERKKWAKFTKYLGIVLAQKEPTYQKPGICRPSLLSLERGVVRLLV